MSCTSPLWQAGHSQDDLSQRADICENLIQDKLPWLERNPKAVLHVLDNSFFCVSRGDTVRRQ